MKRGRPARAAARHGSRGAGDTDGTELHEERLDAVVGHLLAGGCASVVDLGCGSGALLRRLVDAPQFTRIVGVDISIDALARAERDPTLAAAIADGRLALRHGSFTTPGAGLEDFDGAALVETIEHIAPAHLSRVEHALFAQLRPGLVVLTTPNGEYNERYGLAAGQVRRADHRFEWGRARFEAWATGVGRRNGYTALFEAVGPVDAWLGSPTQMAVMRRAAD